MKALFYMALGALLTVGVIRAEKQVNKFNYLVAAERLVPADMRLKALEGYNIKFPRVVLAQSILETRWYTSTIYKENKNAFGMKHNERGYSIGINRGHAKYEKVDHSYLDYQAWQMTVFKLLNKQGKKIPETEDEYLKLLNNLPFREGSRYATDPEYTEKLKQIMKEL